MYLKQTVFFAIFVIKIVTLEETSDNEFFVVSTTQRSNDKNVTAFYFQKQLELVAQMGEYNKKVSILEFQNNQIFKTLEEQKKIIEELDKRLKLREKEIVENRQANEKITRDLEKHSWENNNTFSKLEEIGKRMDLKEQQIDNFRSLTTETLNRLKENTTQKIPQNCQEVKEKGISTSGIYTIQPKTEVITVFCDMDTKGGGWTVIQNRFDGSQNFDLGWEDYKKGFGSLKSEFWLGLDYIYQLTGERSNELYIELVDQNRKKAYAFYAHFRLGSEEEGYKTHLGEEYSGDAGNSLSQHREVKFSTKDKDQDNELSANCALAYGGGWWFTRYSHTNLNGKYVSDSTQIRCGCGFGINWYLFSGDIRSLRGSKMMVRPTH